MIISRIVGGLGNQMFCYAAGKALATRLNAPLKIDTSAYQKYTLHGYLLDQFDITADIANPDECIAYNSASLKHKLLKLLSLKKYKITLYQERSLNYDDQMLNLPDQTYLSGYWQSEQYFSSIEHELRHDFKFKKPAKNLNSDYITRIQSTTSVSVHIRRGDYVSNPNANAVHGTCDLNYYQRATELLHSKLNHQNITYYILSDDPEWVKKNLKLYGEMVFVSHNSGAQGHEDLRLMSACQHHIIANSTFSWWGAWLNPCKEKIVIAPKQWFKDPSYSCRDLVPSSWIRI